MNDLQLTSAGLADLFGAVLDEEDGSATQALDHPSLRHAANEGYRATRKLGEGGMAEVWYGVDRNTSRDVAIKVPHANVEAAVEMLKRESQVLSDLQPPHVAAVIRQSVDGPEPFIVIAFINGGPRLEGLKQA